jgi:hypothetical protein
VKIATALILLHVPGGGEVFVNPAEVTSLRPAREDHTDKYFTEQVNCMVALVDGKFVTVVEPCNVVRKMVEEHK